MLLMRTEHVKIVNPIHRLVNGFEGWYSENGMKATEPANLRVSMPVAVVVQKEEAVS